MRFLVSLESVFFSSLHYIMAITVIHLSQNITEYFKFTKIESIHIH